jgi:adenylate cyclase
MTRLQDLVRRQGERGRRLPAWLDRIVSAGIVSVDPQVIRRQRIINVAALAGAFNAFSRVVANFSYSEHHLLMQAVFSALVVAALLIHRLHRLGDNLAAVAIVAWFLAGVTASTTFYGLQAQAQAYFVLAGVLWFMVGLENWRLTLAGLIVVFIVTLAVLNIAPQQGIAISGDERAIKFLAMQSFVNAITINAFVLFYVVFLLRRAEQDLEHERGRAEELVSVVLPDAIAARLRAEPDRRIADRIDGASVLFGDLVGFTAAAHSATPEEVVDYLDRSVRSFDLMCQTYGVEKIKTIGDSYMAAGGLHGRGRDGAVMIGQLALEMMHAQQRRPPLGGRKLEMRIGIHYGPAIAGVIGDTRIAYDLWGDAVNVASRMESYGVPGRIQVSEQFRDAAGDEFQFAERGTTDIKGIGCTRTFFLLGPRAEPQSEPAAEVVSATGSARAAE